MTSFDVVVIGGGHNGLVCAAMLGKAGRKVLVLEASGVLGGAARTEEFYPGFRASTAHLLSRLHPEVAKALNLDPAKLAKWVLKQVEDRPGVYVEVESQSGERRARAEMSALALRDSQDPAGLVLQALAAADKAVNAPD